MAKSNTAKKMDFTAVDYDGDAIAPDAPAGEWEAVVSVKKMKTSKDKFPMLALEWKLEDTDDEENKGAIGSRVTDFAVFFPKAHRAARMGKLRLRKICELLDISLNLLPKQIDSWDDLEPLIEAIDGQRAKIWTTVKTEEGGETRTNVVYTSPSGFGSSSSSDDDDEEDEDEKDSEEEDEETEETEDAAEDEDEEERTPLKKPAAKAAPASKTIVKGKPKKK